MSDLCVFLNFIFFLFIFYVGLQYRSCFWINEKRTICVAYQNICHMFNTHYFFSNSSYHFNLFYFYNTPFNLISFLLLLFISSPANKSKVWTQGNEDGKPRNRTRIFFGKLSFDFLGNLFYYLVELAHQTFSSALVLRNWSANVNILKQT